MSREIVNPSGLPEPRGYNHAIRVSEGDVVFLAGQDAAGPDEEIVAPDDLVGQFEQVLANLRTVVEEAGGTTRDIMKLNVFVADRDEYAANLEELGEVFTDYFGDHYPAMALFEVGGFFREEALVEMEGFAVVSEGDP